MTKNCKKYDVVVIGGGLAGLTCSILLNRLEIKTLLIEKRQYPFHRVCGEYVSNEVKGFLEFHNLLPKSIEFSEIDKFLLSSISGKKKIIDLDLGGFGISRYAFDNHLYEIAKDEGVSILFDEVTEINFLESEFQVNTKQYGELTSELLIGAFGKRSKLDQKLKRDFIKKKSPYIGVKYHIKYDFDKHTVALHNFEGGYCGINAIEAGKFNLCYLSHRYNLKNHKDIPGMENEILFKNPHLKKIFNEAEFLFDKPEVINEISFETKGPIENHILMIGDAAGMITPLCGNGMAMAIHASKIAVEEVSKYFVNHRDRKKLEMQFQNSWNKQFKKRLAFGRTVQNLFGKPAQSDFAIKMLSIKPLADLIIKSTHGKPIRID